MDETKASTSRQKGEIVMRVKAVWRCKVLIVVFSLSMVASFLTGCGQPLRIGTIGATYYHRVDCPLIARSLETYGPNYRVKFYTWWGISLSRRVPDLKVCYSQPDLKPYDPIEPFLLVME